MITEEMKLEGKKLVGVEYEDEFLLNEALAVPIIKMHDTTLLRGTTVGFGLMEGYYTNYIVGFNLDKVIEFAVPLSTEQTIIPPAPDFKETSDYLTNYAKKKQRVRIGIWVLCTVLLISTFLFYLMVININK